MESSKIYQSLSTKAIAPSSLLLYCNNLRRLNGGVFPKNFTFLKDTDAIMSRLAKFKQNTQRSYLVSIVTTLKCDPKMKKLYKFYYNHLDQINRHTSVNTSKSETQEKNWMSQEEVTRTLHELQQQALPLINKRARTPEQFTTILKWLTLSLYVHQKPRRNKDYQICLIVQSLPDEMDKQFNYISLADSKFYFNNYKTARTYKTQIVDCSPEMLDVIRKWVKVHPLRQEFKLKQPIHLLVNHEGGAFTRTNAVTRLLNSVFNGNVGSSLLRNIFLTDKYAQRSLELSKDAQEMGTSVHVIQNQYVKQDGDAPETN